jgi:predicted secreted protein
MTQIIFSTVAVYFVIWWITLFAVLPFGHRSQADDNEVVLGTVASAPTKFRPWRVVLMTTLVSALIYGGWFILTGYFGFSFDKLPHVVPRYGG